jgi:DNA-binding response OmpR family regulator
VSGSPREILVVEDDAAIRRGIVDALEHHGFRVIEASDGHEGMRCALGVSHDLLLLDLMLPGPGGLEILQAVRSARPTDPVIILTARGDEDERVRGLRLGADDYVVKPFSVKELIARVEAVLRRTPGRPSDVREVNLDDGIADLERSEIRFEDGERSSLSSREADLLRYLVRNAGRPISREEILANVWRIDPSGAETRTIDMHVARLREKLRDDPATPRIVVTVRGKGYMFGSQGPSP